MAVNYQTEVAIKQHRIPKHGLHITYSRDPPKKPLGSGGPIKKAERRIGHNEPFFVLNGDIFSDVDYRELLKMHEKRKAVATIALYEVEDPTRYGVAKLAEGNRIEKFVEKPSRRTAPSKLINAGAYILSPEIFHYVPKKRTVSIEREVFTQLAEEGLLYGYTFNGLWMDIGKPEDYLQINKTLLDSSKNQQSKCKIGKNSIIKTPVSFDKRVSIGEKSVIGPYVVLGRNVNIENDVHIEESMILSEVFISTSSTLKGAIIGDGVIIGKRVKIGKGCIVGDHARINNNVELAERVSVCPAKEISESVLTPKCIT